MKVEHVLIFVYEQTMDAAAYRWLMPNRHDKCSQQIQIKFLKDIQFGATLGCVCTSFGMI